MKTTIIKHEPVKALLIQQPMNSILIPIRKWPFCTGLHQETHHKGVDRACFNINRKKKLQDYKLKALCSINFKTNMNQDPQSPPFVVHFVKGVDSCCIVFLEKVLYLPVTLGLVLIIICIVFFVVVSLWRRCSVVFGFSINIWFDRK